MEQLSVQGYRRCKVTRGIQQGGSGFTLIEVALVLVVLGLVVRVAIVPLGDLQAHRQRHTAEQQLLQIRQALFAHVVAYGALPCPVVLGHRTDRSVSQHMSPVSNGRLHRAYGANGLCDTYQGGVPARELGLPGAISSDQALLDPWNRVYRYSVSSANHAQYGDSGLGDWTSAGEASLVGIKELQADLSICAKAAGASCPRGQLRADRLAFVVLSSGPDASGAGAQEENSDMDNEFVLLPESVRPDAPFDDLLVWGSSADVIYHLMKMGWLP